MEEEQKWEEYSLRTLAYYQREGGIYNDLITVLQRIRAEKGVDKISAPNVILNLASQIYDFCLKSCTDESGQLIADHVEPMLSAIIGRRGLGGSISFLSKLDQSVVLCVLCVLLSQHPDLNKEMVPSLWKRATKKNHYTTYFEPLLNKALPNEPMEIELLKRELADRDNIIASKDEQITELIKERDHLNGTVYVVLSQFENYIEKFGDISDFDQTLSLDSILGWIRGRRHYALTDQVFIMLKDLGRKVATDEDYEKINDVEKELIENYRQQSVINNNMGFGSNFLTGAAQNPLLPIGVSPEQMSQLFLSIMQNGAGRENKD